VTFLGAEVFYGCRNLAAIEVAPENSAFCSVDGVVFTKDMTALVAYPNGKASLHYEIPQGVVTIQEGAFGDSAYLASVTLPNSATTIGKRAFAYCGNLILASIGNVEVIGEDAFANCDTLICVKTGNDVARAWFAENYPAVQIIGLEEAASVANVDDVLYLLYDGQALVAGLASGEEKLAVTIAAEVESYPVTAIKENAFKHGYNLASVTIPDSVTSIEDDTFEGCIRLETVYTDSEYVAEWFAEHLPDVEVLPIHEEEDDYFLDGLYYYFAGGEATVEGTDSPEYVTIVIPDTVLDCPVTAIGYGAFGECYDLTTITIPATVTSIADLAFDECDALTTAYTDSEYVANWFSENMPDVEVVPVTAPPLPDPYDKRVDNLLFHIENGFATVSGVWDPDFTSVIVPDAVDGFPVTAIGDRAFSQCRKLSSITLPGGLTSIGIWAFYGCDALTELTIPDGVTSIGDYAFSYCENLIAINIPDGVTSIGVNTFIHCNKLLTIDLPSGLTSIGDGAFSYCEMLSSVSLPESLTTIGKQAFKQCYQLASVNLPDGVTSIGDDAFVSCTTLTTIELPASVNTIGEGAFSNCENLTGIHVAQSNSDFVDVDGVLYNSAITRLLAYPTRKDGDVFTVPETVTSIDAQAFSRCSRLHNITLPEGLTEIGAMAFSLCEGLTVINIPTSVDSIGESAFLVCRRLENIYVAEGNSNYTSVDGVLFNRDKTRLVAYPSGKFLQDYDIPDTVTGIDNYAFYHCFKLDKISISDTVTSIGEMAFDWCTDLVGVSIGKGVSSIPKYAFGRCSSLTEVIIYGEVNNIDQYAFEGCRALSTVYTDSEYVSFWFAEKMPAVTIKPLDEVPLPDPYDKTIDGIRYHVEDGVVTVTGVVSGFITTAEIPDAVDGFPVTAIGSHAFDDCRDLIKLTIPDSVTTIGDYAFYYCIKLPSVILPAKLTSIGEYAFSLCFKLTNVTIPAGVTSIGANAFYACDQLKTITIPAATQSIGKAAFSDCANLRSITVDEDNSYYEDLDGVLFNKEMTHLITCPVYKDGDSFVIPATVTHIDAGAFTGCHRLESITIPEGVIVLGDGAFSSCSGLRRIIIPQSVTSLGQNVFVGCQNLEAFYVAAGNPVCVSEDGVLFSADKTRLISYPAGNRALQYDIPTTVTTIESDAFFLSDSLVKVTIPDSVTSIGESAFDFCSKLTSITIPDSVTSIERYTFNRCEKLSMVTIPASVTSIGYGAFNNCPSLSTVYTDSEYVANWFAENMPSVNVIFNGGEAVEQQLELAPGWNLVTLQFPVTAESMTTLLGLRPIRFDEAGRAYVCCETPAEIVIGAGLWIFSAYAQTITLEKDQTQTSWEAAAPTTDWSLLGVSETSSWQDQATSVQQWQDGAFMDADKSLLNSGAGYWVRP